MSLPQHRQEGLVRSQCSLSNTHTHSNTHSDGDRALLFFSNLLHEKVYSALDSHLADGRSVQERTIIAQGKYYCRPDLRLKVFPLSVFVIPGEAHPPSPLPLRNYHLHQSPRSSMATLSKHTRRRSSHFHNNQHGTFRPKYINAQNEHIAGKWTVIVLCYFWTATQVSLGHVNILLTMLFLCSNVFTILFSFFVMCVLGLKKPLLTFADKWTALFEDIKGSAMFAQRRKCPLLFALDDAQVMNISPQIYIKVSFQMEGLGKSIWIPSMTIPSPSELNLRGGHLCLLPEALIGPSSLFTTKFCSTYVTETRQN